jgi:murein DD-endopeptidase MepM/ murein hydrolase activator NlpD
LLGLLGTPVNVGVERPSLEHFGVQTPITDAAADQPGGGGGIFGGGLPTILWELAVASLLGASVLTVRAGRGRPRLYRAAVVTAIPFAVVIALAATTRVSSVPTVQAPPAKPAAVPVSRAVAPSATASLAPQVTPAGSALFNRVVALETALVHDAATINILGVLVQQATLPDPAQAPSHGQGGPGSNFAGAEHGEALALEGLLQQEYDFYAAAAHDPAQASALMETAATRSPLVRDVVAYNVQAVQAAQAQQTAIAVASQSVKFNPAGVSSAGSPIALRPPLGGVITQAFGPTWVAIEPAFTANGVTYPHFHTGLDIAAPRDTPVHAAGDGVVALAGAETDGYGHLVGYGYYAVIAHAGGMITLYGHLDQLLVRPQQVVQAGDPIGLEGSTGNSTGPHLHFEVRINGLLADPARYLTVQ